MEDAAQRIRDQYEPDAARRRLEDGASKAPAMARVASACCYDCWRVERTAEEAGES